MNNRMCKNCRYYRQHYTLDSRKIFRINCGHCTFSNPRRKRPDTVACENYVSRSVETNAFASKEYLSKELLKYVLELELLPDITDDPVPLK